MGYMHIENLYKNTDIMAFKECYALEKIHGTSAHIKFTSEDGVSFFSGGEKHDKFIKLFNSVKLEELYCKVFEEQDCPDVTLFGEAYGGKQQGMSETYGKELKFIVFDVKIGDTWLDVPNAYDVACKLDQEFVDWVKCDTKLETLNGYRDIPSRQAKRNGIVEDKIAEGIVLRPLVECTKSNGNRIIVKHKREEFNETKTVREVDPEKLKILEEAREIAIEWVTEMRMKHVLDKLGNPDDIKETGAVVKAMIEDVLREAKGEIVESQNTKKAIGTASARMYKEMTSKI